jgi:hypothetical protein
MLPDLRTVSTHSSHRKRHHFDDGSGFDPHVTIDQFAQCGISIQFAGVILLNSHREKKVSRIPLFERGSKKTHP